MYKMDVHVHTAETSPCGKVKGLEIARLYKEAGYHGVVITDHFYKGLSDRYVHLGWADRVNEFLSGYRSVKEAGAKVGLVVLPAMELRLVGSPNDYLVYGLTEDYLVNAENLHEYTLQEVAKQLKKENALIYQAHPYRSHIKVVAPHMIDGVEVFNGNPRHNSNNHMALAYAQEHGLKMISGSDFHQEEDLARGGIVTERKISTMEEFMDVLRSGQYELIRDVEAFCA